MVTFAKANDKLKKLEKKRKKRVYSFNLLAGHTCPFAKDCKSKVVKKRGQLTVVDGPKCKFRCYAASGEARQTNVYESHRRNTRLVKKSKDEIVKILLRKIPKKAGIIRIHVSGDFCSQKYFDAWLEVARLRPDIVFYAYTKAITYWVRRLGQIPRNMCLTASLGGTQDALVYKFRLRRCEVVKTKKEAKSKRLRIETDESIVSDPKRKRTNVAVLVHGVQPAGSEYGIYAFQNRKPR